MTEAIEIEDIEEMRRLQGIDDVELRAAIRVLSVGDIVKLTFIAKSRSMETVSVRITEVRGSAFRGKLVEPALSMGRGKLVAFRAAHVHSVVRVAIEA